MAAPLYPDSKYPRHIPRLSESGRSAFRPLPAQTSFRQGSPPSRLPPSGSQAASVPRSLGISDYRSVSSANFQPTGTTLSYRAIRQICIPHIASPLAVDTLQFLFARSLRSSPCQFLNLITEIPMSLPHNLFSHLRPSFGLSRPYSLVINPSRFPLPNSLSARMPGRLSCYAFTSKLLCISSTFTISSLASGMPLFAFPHASL